MDKTIKRWFGWILAVFIVLSAGTIGYAYNLVRTKVINNAEEKAKINMVHAADKMADYMYNVEMFGNMLAASMMHAELRGDSTERYPFFWFDSNTPKKPIEEVYGLLKEFLAAAPQLWGAVVAFEPGVYLGEGERFAAFVRHASEKEYVMHDLTQFDPDYDEAEWYAVPRETGRPYWARPFIGAKEDTVAVYCIPMHGENERFIGVMTVSCNLNHVYRDMTRQLSFYNGAELYTLDKELNILLSPKSYEILNRKIDSFEAWKEELANQDLLLFYSDVPNYDRVLALTCPRKAVFEAAQSISNKILLLNLCNFVIFIAFGIISYKIVQKKRARKK